jgi:hypothetical protein
MKPSTVQKEEYITELFREHNQLRVAPLSFLPYLKERMTQFREDNLHYIRSNLAVKTKEGREPIQQLIQELEVLPAMGQLTWSNALHRAADSLAVELG